MNIVIVESPAKAKTINKYLGSSYEVLASFGHVRDLPAKNGSVDPDHNFRMIWEVDSKAAGRLNDIAKSLKGADRLILATDPDREGEAISWHVLEVLKEKRALKDQKIERVVFNAITKQAITEAMKNPRQIDGALVDAYMARRALDYLVGFTLSPVLWRKLPGEDRAGGVQRHHQAGGHGSHEESAPDRRRAGRRLHGAPRAGLSGRLHPLPRAVAQAARRALGRPGAVGGTAAGLRP